MAGYGTALAADFFAGSVSFFNDLAGQLCADATAAMTHDQLEELIEVRGRELLRLLLQDHLDLRAVREEQSLAAARQAGRSAARVMVDVGGVAHRVIETGHERCLASVVGPVTVRRAAFRAGGTANLYPADARLNLPAGRHSHGLRKRAVVEAVRGSFDDAVTAIRRCCGNVVAKRQVERLVITAARDVEAFYEARVPLPCTAATLLVISCDGKGVPMRPEALRPATRRAAAVKAVTPTRPGWPAGRRADARGWPRSRPSTTPNPLCAALTT